jgi:hypothetical protein
MDPLANNIDRLTLELLTNRKQYRQYLKHTDTKKYLEQTDFLQKIRKHKSSILDIIHQLLDEPENQFSNEMNDTFIPFIHSILKYIDSMQIDENKDSAAAAAASCDNDILFDNCIESALNTRRRGSGSYSDNMVQYSMQMFMKPKPQTHCLMTRQKQNRFIDKNNGNENNISNDYKEYYDSDQEEI